MSMGQRQNKYANLRHLPVYSRTWTIAKLGLIKRNFEQPIAFTYLLMLRFNMMIIIIWHTVQWHMWTSNWRWLKIEKKTDLIINWHATFI